MDKYKIAFDAIASIIEGYETSVACNEKETVILSKMELLPPFVEVQE